MLEIEGLEASYGSVKALKGVTLTVNEGEIVSLIGANGAGKSTLLFTIAGIICAGAGRIRFCRRDITNSSADGIVAQGISLVPEGRRIFAEMSVEENLSMGAHLRRGANVRASMDELYALFPILAERRRQPGGTLSGGEQQMLAISRALMGSPRLLLLDEPSLGLAPIIVQQIFDIIRRINTERRVTILLVEQNAHMALKVAGRGYVLETGRIVLADDAKRLAGNEDVKRAYLGI
ncbi:MAG: ABC transporter ATP-binding protein [Spirochaetes bacterium]|nr:ABC transporter ATP-binding protein [Spirochaetota bacterium]